MLKITIQPKKTSTRLVLEGRLTGPWVEELRRCWAAADVGGGEVNIDLAGVTFIDTEGKALLTRMWHSGAKLHAVGCLTRCIVEEITKAEPAVSSRPNGGKDKGRG
jgi:ABC-type transporter Mla MlaB component